MTVRINFLIPCITSNLQPKTDFPDAVSTNPYEIMWT